MNHHITKAAVHRQYKLCYHVSPIFWTGTLTKLVRCICVATVVQNITKTTSWFTYSPYTITHTSSCSSTNHINKPNILWLYLPSISKTLLRYSYRLDHPQIVSVSRELKCPFNRYWASTTAVTSSFPGLTSCSRTLSFCPYRYTQGWIPVPLNYFLKR